ncbi:XRE family transcriptional regulator [Planctomycetales bacterium]|nr:XRE family transcriptional regulator [Planctomycetales bacterium]GHT05583.1 XRE family transcriptional regulator [Planctomycetales bacterium]GHV20234.1 XRE family transcriptional regulator [Planctomycetales bacterium]
MSNAVNVIGEKMKTIRESQNMPVAEVAEKSKCPTALIEKLEAGELVPSLTPLLKITRALGVRLGTLLDDMESTGPVVHRAAERERVIHFSGEQSSADKSQLDFFALAQNKADRHIEPFLIKVHPLPVGAKNQLSSHEGEEFIYVLSGGLQIIYGNETYHLQKGDSIYLDSVVPHSVFAEAGIETEILASIYEPQ